ncbi:glycosyltransferase family 39 protein [Rufibacter psychrotolerans]|uniref:glycosyltransferase family 39 protein n=1 Tax=Rufibacter psychrotolerans TaxID=2812556 RepID=UPI0019677662|nr:glycosyltransferase family 39 protein [Rufibacter sp. SYSU D00308]
MALRSDTLVQGRFLPLTVLLGLGLVYAAFPTQNSTSDAYDYAACVKWQVDLWQPHHLLYNITGLGAYTLVHRLGLPVAPLELMQFLNSLFAGASLWVLWRIIAPRQKSRAVQAGLLLLAGASLGTLRYATENETYIIPLFFSLLGSYFWATFQESGQKRHLLWSSFWAAWACLYHQIHFFWWLGLLLHFLLDQKRSWKLALWFVVPALVVPLGYAVVMELQGMPLLQAHRFIFLDFYKGEVETTVTYQHFLLTGISLVRTFFEVHGRQYYLVQQNVLYILPALGTLLLLGKACLLLLPAKPRLSLPTSAFCRTHGLILLLHLLFAWFAVGNAEFMVMVPWLLALLLSCSHKLQARPLLFAGLGLFIWNMAYAVGPNYGYTYANFACTRAYVQRQPQATLLLADKNAFDAYLFYHTGQYSPRAFEISAPTPVLEQAIAEATREARPVVTDFAPQSPLLNRAWLLWSTDRQEFFSRYHLSPVTACPTFFGDKGLSQVHPEGTAGAE